MTENRLSVGLGFIEGEPAFLIQMNSEWRTLPYASALILVEQMIAIIGRIKPAEGAPRLIRSAEYGPYVDPARRPGSG